VINPHKPKATRRSRVGKLSEASGTRGIVRSFYMPSSAAAFRLLGAGKRDSFIASGEQIK